jgi:hypothetical protein
MIEGSQNLDIKSCDAMKPISGYDGKTSLVLVRNPNYNARTDSTKARENNPDRFEFTVDTNLDDIYNKIAAGDLEDEYATASPKVFREYSTDASKRKYLHSNSADQTYFITMNLTQPPFDDVHVRRAMNWVADRNSLRKAWGGPIAGEIGEHIMPNSMTGGKLENYAPFKTAGGRGSVAKAKAEMKLSKYANKAGVCSAKQCKGVLLIQDVRTADKGILPPFRRVPRRSGSHSRCGPSRARIRRSKRWRTTSRSRLARVGARTTRTRRHSSTRCSWVPTSSRSATGTTRSSG